MSDVKWTRGEWEVSAGKVGVVDRSDTQAYGMTLVIAHIDRFDFPDEWDANAHLIAESPNLYSRLRASTEVMESVLESLGDHERESVLDEIEQNESALAKARGQS